MADSNPDLPLFRRAPSLASTVPRLPLGTFPTPVAPFEIETGSGPLRLLVKRDDIGAEGYAGNKVRKLEFLLADARARGATRLITAGAAGSHHAFATAYHGGRAGFDVSLVLFPQHVTSHVREMLFLDAAAGAELVWASRMETVPYGVWRARVAHRREVTCTIPPGGSNPIGTFGYVNGALELVEQIGSGQVEKPSSIHVAAGTLGTAAGIAIGLAWAGLPIPVIATRITVRLLTNERALAALIRSTLAQLRDAGAHDLPDAAEAAGLVELRHDQIGAGYGRPTEAGARAAERFAAAGLRLDATYTAKAAAGLLAQAGGSGLPLFWHTLSAVEPAELLRRASPDLPAPFSRYLAGAA
ncbi:MAG TPA: pyridoxal-phosphate dependent enzyme [Longimicrobiales bacterium]